MTANLSNHLVRDRIDRMNYIVNQIGIGTVIIEAIDPKTHAIRQLTDTGIMIIKSEKEDKIITMYVANQKNLHECYKWAGRKKVPEAMENKVKKNKIHIAILDELKKGA